MARVAMLVSNRYDPDPRVQKEAASLVAAGHEVDVYAFDREHAKSVLHQTLDGVHIHRLQLGHFAYGKVVPTLIGLPRFLSATKKLLLAQAPDVVHCHDQDTCPVGMWWSQRGARLVHRDRGGRGLFVYDAHDFYWTFLLMGEQQARWRRMAAKLLERRERRYAEHADLLFTVTEGIGHYPGTAELYRQWGLHPIVLWNAPRRVSEQPALPARFTVGYYGAVREPGMFRFLLDAIARLPPAQRPALRVAGGGTAQARVAEMLAAASRELGIAVTVTGAFDMSQMSALMAECSLQFCVYPRGSGNIDRSLPVKLLDAVAYGRKVIGNADTLMADFIEANGWGSVVHEGDVAALALALAAAQRELAGCSQPLPLPAPPTWDEQAEKLCAAYQRMLSSSRAR